MNVGKRVDDAVLAQAAVRVPWNAVREQLVFERAVSGHASRRARKQWFRAGASALAGVAVFVIALQSFGRPNGLARTEHGDSVRAAKIAVADGSSLDGGYEAAVR